MRRWPQRRRRSPPGRRRRSGDGVRRLLDKLAEAHEPGQDEFAHLQTQEHGRPLPQAQWEIAQSIAVLRYFATLDLPLEVLKEDGTQKVVRQHRPLGVVAAITAWNVPMILLTIKVAPALLAGNTVVAKPAPTAPLTTLKFGELCARILQPPPGVVNVIVDQNDLGAALTQPPRRGQGRVHRLDRYRQEGDGQRRRDVEAPDPGTRWERRGDRLGRRRSEEGGAEDLLRRHAQLRAGVYRYQTGLRPRVALRCRLR